MLIKNGNLDIKEFKDFFDKIEWIKAPRNLSTKIKEFFYLATYEDDNKVIKISIRPSMRMKISESFKNKLVDGSDPKNKEDKNAKYEFGTTIEVLIDNELLDRIKKKAQPPKENSIQKVIWS